MKTPPTFVIMRAASAVLTALILAAAGLGLAGGGPLGVLHAVTTGTVHWLHTNTGVNIR